MKKKIIHCVRHISPQVNRKPAHRHNVIKVFRLENRRWAEKKRKKNWIRKMKALNADNIAWTAQQT